MPPFGRVPSPRSATLVAAGLTLALLLSPALEADARADGERGIEQYRRGNLIEGMQLLQQSAAAGYAPAQTTLAFIMDAAEDDARAIYWYRQAAAADDPGGLFGLGGMYSKGEGTAADPNLAGQLIGRAARLGHVQAMRVYAHAQEHGQLGLAPNQERAAEWYRSAAEAGDEISMQRLRLAYTQGQLGLPIDSGQAEYWADRIRRGAEN